MRERSQDPPPAKLARQLTNAQAARWWQNIEQRFAYERAYLQAYVRELLTELVGQLRADADRGIDFLAGGDGERWPGRASGRGARWSATLPDRIAMESVRHEGRAACSCRQHKRG